MSNVGLSVVCAILEFIIFLFVVLSVCLDVLRIQGKYNNCVFSDLLLSHTAQLTNTSNACPRVCFSDWGIKRCGPHKTNPNKLPNRGFPGKYVLRLVNAGAAFEIISIAVTLLAFIFSLLAACKCMSATIVVVFDIVAVITIIIAVGCLLGVYYKDIREIVAALLGNDATVIATVAGIYPELFRTSKTKVKQLFDLYVAVGLVVCGWCLQVIVLILMIINACCC